MKMNLHRAKELIEPLRKGTAEGISQHWQARLIEALEYVIEHEGGTEQSGKEMLCVYCGKWKKYPSEFPVRHYAQCQECAQHSVHLTLRTLRHLQAFFSALSLSLRTAFRRPSQRR